MTETTKTKEPVRQTGRLGVLGGTVLIVLAKLAGVALAVFSLTVGLTVAAWLAPPLVLLPLGAGVLLLTAAFMPSSFEVRTAGVVYSLAALLVIVLGVKCGGMVLNDHKAGWSRVGGFALYAAGLAWALGYLLALRRHETRPPSRDRRSGPWDVRSGSSHFF